MYAAPLRGKKDLSLALSCTQQGSFLPHNPGMRRLWVERADCKNSENIAGVSNQ